MSYNDSVPEAEQTTVCPYNKAHVLLNFRFNNHLIKCRKSYTGEDLETCPFNSSHKIPKPEFYFHKKTCIDRKNVVNYIQTDQPAEPKEKKKVKNWDEDEELKAKDENLKVLIKSAELPASNLVDLNDNELDFDEFGRKQIKDEGRHGCDEEADENAHSKLYNPLAHLRNALNSSSNSQLDQSERHYISTDNNPISSNENIPSNPKTPKKGDWSDEEDDVPSNYVNSGASRYGHSQHDSRSYRESSIDSFKSNRSHFQQTKTTSRPPRNHSNSPNSFKSRNSPYSRPDSRQVRETSRESDSNVSTTSRQSQNFRHRHERSFDHRNSKVIEGFGSHESSGSRGSSRIREFAMDSRSREPSKSRDQSRCREPSVGYNQNRFGRVRRDSNASGYSNRSGTRGSPSGRFDGSNLGSSSKYEDEFAKILETIDNHPQEFPSHPTEAISLSQHKDTPNNQNTRKTSDWSDEEDDVPASNQRFLQNSPSSSSSPQNNFVSSTTEAAPTQKRKLQDWSDEEDDVTPSSNIFNDSSSNWNNKSSARWDDDDGTAVPITKSKRSRRYCSDRPSDEEILERFAKLSNFKDFMSEDSYFDKGYRGRMNGNMVLGGI